MTVVRQAHIVLPLGPAPREVELPAGVWEWRTDDPSVLSSSDGSTFGLRPDFAVVHENGIFIHGHDGRYTIRTRSTDGLVATLPSAIEDGA